MIRRKLADAIGMAVTVIGILILVAFVVYLAAQIWVAAVQWAVDQ